jgi:hypothetical protein
MLATRGNKLSTQLIKYIENTPNVIIYKLGEHHIPSNIFFPNAKEVTIINCNKLGVFNILSPYIFPNIKRINYLSAHPGNFNIYTRFNHDIKSNDCIKWVFPNKEYDFYDYIIRKKIGSRDNSLINIYLKNKKVIDGTNGFDISFYFDIDLPNFGLVEGEWYRNQFYEYCVNKQNEIINYNDKELM